MFNVEKYINIAALWQTLWSNRIKYQVNELQRTINHIHWLKHRYPVSLLIKENEIVYAVYKKLQKDTYLCLALTENTVQYVTLNGTTAETSALSVAGFVALLDFKPTNKD